MKAVLIAMVILLVGVSLVEVAIANPYAYGPPSINITYSPEPSTNSVVLKISITMWKDPNNCTREAWYSLDGQEKVPIPLTFKGSSGSGDFIFSEVTGETKMPMWSQGPHIINVTIKYDYGSFSLINSKLLYIGQPEPTPTPPILNIISPKNQSTYNTSSSSNNLYCQLEGYLFILCIGYNWCICYFWLEAVYWKYNNNWTLRRFT